MIMADALIEVLITSEGRERMTSNLHPMATRALFAGTADLLTNTELLKLLRPHSLSGEVGRDTKEARNFRSVGKERGLKIGDLRRHALDLLQSGKFPQADIARAWTYAQIHCSAMQTVREFRALRTELGISTLGSDPKLANDMLNKCYELIVAAIQNEFEIATQAVKARTPNSEQRRFLHFSTGLIIDALNLDRPALATWKDLLENVYPEIDRYYLGNDTEQVSSYLSSPPPSRK